MNKLEIDIKHVLVKIGYDMNKIEHIISSVIIQNTQNKDYSNSDPSSVPIHKKQ